jgi:G:T-mismatch repair DNA endonuclease (very short patch repair protein)
MKDKPRIVLNKHKHAPYKYRCYWGRYNGYADTVEKAYKACIKCVKNSKYLMTDIKRNPQLARVLETKS